MDRMNTNGKTPEQQAVEVMHRRYGLDPTPNDWSEDEHGRPGLALCIVDAIKEEDSPLSTYCAQDSHFSSSLRGSRCYTDPSSNKVDRRGDDDSRLRRTVFCAVERWE